MDNNQKYNYYSSSVAKRSREATKKWKWYVYIVECKDGTFYTGMTWKIPVRMDQHISGLGSKYTQKHGFKKLVYFEEHVDIEEAQSREIQLKDWNQAKKKKLISGQWKKDY